MKLRRLLHLLPAVCVVATATFCRARAFEVPEGWTTDCVGRMQISMPGPIEVAAYSAKSFAKLYASVPERAEFEFEDGQIAGYSQGHPITHPLTQRQINELLGLAKQHAENIRLRTMKDKKNRFEYLDVAPKIGVANRYNSTYTLVLLMNTHLLNVGAAYLDRDWPPVRQEFEASLNNTRFRAIGELPSEPGICMPYAFQADSGSGSRFEAATYRLKEHPDITVMLQDVQSSPPPEIASTVNLDSAKSTPESEIAFFWRQMYQDPKRVETLWPLLHPVRLANVSGKASLMRLTRRDDQIDYGYYAVAVGDYRNKEDTPYLNLYVIQDSKNAKAKGIEPMGKDEFVKLAQEIAASVRHRPVITVGR